MDNILALLTCFNRPEMLYITLESHKKALKEYEKSYNKQVKFIFFIDIDKKGYLNNDIISILKSFNQEKEIHIQSRNMGSSKNILTGYNYCFNNLSNNNDYLIVLEDDFIVHKYYYNVIEGFFNIKHNDNFVGLSLWLPNTGGNPNKIICQKGNYCHLGGVMTKYFYEKFVRHHSNELLKLNDIPDFTKYIDINIDNPYRNIKEYPYSMFNGNWYEQDGMIKRLSYIANIEENLNTYISSISWLSHFGFYGINRRSFTQDNKLSLEYKIKFVENVIQNHNYNKYDTIYNDYFQLSTELDNWNNQLNIHSSVI